MPQNEFTIGTIGTSFKESKIFIGITTIFLLIFTFLENPDYGLDIKYSFYLLPIFLIFLLFSIIYGILKQKEIKTKLTINENNIFIKTYKKELLQDEIILDKNSTFNIKTIDHSTTRGWNIDTIKTHLFISDYKNKLEYTINSSDIPLINQALLSIQNKGIEEINKIVQKDKRIRGEHNFIIKVGIIGILFIIIIGALSIILALKYINK